MEENTGPHEAQETGSIDTGDEQPKIASRAYLAFEQGRFDQAHAFLEADGPSDDPLDLKTALSFDMAGIFTAGALAMIWIIVAVQTV